MKRDMELVRKILLTIEAETPNDFGGITKIEGYDDTVAGHHVKWLEGGGFIEAALSQHSDGISWVAIDLTWKGHEFLENARNDTVWKRVVGQIRDKGGSLSLAVIESMLTKAATDFMT